MIIMPAVGVSRLHWKQASNLFCLNVKGPMDVYYDDSSGLVVVSGGKTVSNDAAAISRHEVAQVLVAPSGQGDISDEDMCECIFGGDVEGEGSKIQVRCILIVQYNNFSSYSDVPAFRAI